MGPLFLIFTLIISATSLPLGSLSGSIDLNTAIQLPTANPKEFTILPGFPDSGRQRAVLEQETPLSKLDSAYSNTQQLVADLLNPKPIVDTIREEDKYGNDGEKFNSFGRVVVNGFEALSNTLNAIVDVPTIKVRQFGKKITANLNAIGGKLVGL